MPAKRLPFQQAVDKAHAEMCHLEAEVTGLKAESNNLKACNKSLLCMPASNTRPHSSIDVLFFVQPSNVALHKEVKQKKSELKGKKVELKALVDSQKVKLNELMDARSVKAQEVMGTCQTELKKELVKSRKLQDEKESLSACLKDATGRAAQAEELNRRALNALVARGLAPPASVPAQGVQLPAQPPAPHQGKAQHACDDDGTACFFESIVGHSKSKPNQHTKGWKLRINRGNNVKERAMLEKFCSKDGAISTAQEHAEESGVLEEWADIIRESQGK